MIDKIINFLFSMKMMAIEMFIFAFSIGLATFIESDYGTPASKIAIYNTVWFEVLLFHLSLILIVNMIKYKMYQRKKWPTFMFHLAFLLIIVGAAVTRYFSEEGQMRIPIGESTNIIYSTIPNLLVKANDGKKQFTYIEERWLSEGVENPFEFDVTLPNHQPVSVEYVSYKENMIDTLVNDENGGNALNLVIRGQDKFIFQGKQGLIGNLNFSFDAEHPLPGMHVITKNRDLFISSAIPFQIINMGALSAEDRKTGQIDSSAVSFIPADSLVSFIPFHLYKIGKESIMFKSLRKGVKMKKIKAAKDDMGENILTLKFSSKDDSKIIQVLGSEKHIMEKEYFEFNGLNFEVGYGAKPMVLPFYIKCRDFQLDRYPGSNMASSYASEVTVLDSVNGVVHDQRIFMNNVMDYGGYRFFQSSYFADESGTILSVNHDWWGTLITYIGYTLMGLGMFISIFNPKGRIAELNNLIRKSRNNRKKLLKTITLIIGLGLSGAVYSQSVDSIVTENEVTTHTDSETHSHEEHSDDHEHAHSHSSNADFVPEKRTIRYLSKDDAEELDELLIQNYNGRITPYNTLAKQLLRKIHRSDEYKGKNAVQVITAMHLYGPISWQDEEIIYVSSKIRDELGTGRYASIGELEDKNGLFKWMEDYKDAYGKPDSEKNEYDKELIKLGEKYRVIKEVLAYRYLKIIPLPDNDNGKWVYPFSKELMNKDQTGNALSLNFLRTLFLVSQGEIDFDKAEDILESLMEYQWKNIREYEAAHPNHQKLTETHVEIEVLYNKLNVFDKTQMAYLLLGLILLIIFFIRTLVSPTQKSESLFKKISYPFIGLIILTFLAHGTALGMRWYITGHAPWSNGYEAVIFISWATILAGLFFIRKNPAVIAATVLLSALMLFVTSLNVLNPQMTPLEPVLKSYWLMIHVSIITSSYGFIGISSILGLLNMFLYLFKTKNNKKRLQMNIMELTAVSEIIMIVGLFALSIGTFIGGVWANESWGRYWGWDPKEVWALISMLVFAIIIHLRLIPKLSSRFLFNVLSLWGYAAILFTFFGVNYVLVGLHSYAQGDGVTEWPLGAIISIWAFAIFTATVAVKYLYDKKRFATHKNKIEQ